MENNKPIIELELYLIRHGQSMGNAGYNGRTDLTLKEGNDPLLTEKGLIQADKLGTYLSNTEFDQIYSSGLIRAICTADGIIRHQTNYINNLNILPILSEVGISPEYDGITLKEMEKFCLSATFADGISENTPRVYHSTFENESEIFCRAESVMNYLQSRYKKGERIAIVSHAAFLTILIFYIMGFDEAPVFDIAIDNTAITKVIFYKKGTNKYGDISFEYINSTKHLD